MAVKIEKVGLRIYLQTTFPISKSFLDIPGSSFSKQGFPHWSIPLSMVNCRSLRARFGQQLEIGPQLRNWAFAEVAREQELRALGRASDAELVRLGQLAPKLAAAMAKRTYQRVGAKFIADTRAALIADDPGLGKTLEALGGIVESGVAGPYLIVCPKTAVESVWVPEIKRWLGVDAISVPDGRAKREEILNWVVYGNAYDGQDAFETEAEIERHEARMKNAWVVVHPEMIRSQSWWECRQCGELTETWAGPKMLECGHDPKQAPRKNTHTFEQLFQVEWGAVVFDESHNSLIRKTGKNTQTRNGAELLQIRDNGIRLALSGTPFRGKKHLLWGTLNWLFPKVYTGAGRWTQTYFQVTEGWGGSREIGELKPEMEQELHRELDKVMLRRTKGEVAPDMPRKTYVGTPLVPGDDRSPVGVWLPMLPAQRRAYDQILKASTAAIEGGELSAIGVLAEMTRLKQFATSAGRMVGEDFQPAMPSNKFEWIWQHIEEMGIKDRRNTTRLVIVSQFTNVLELFGAELNRRGVPACSITGKVTGNRRAKVIADFNQPGVGPEVMLLNIKAGGVAITIDSADEMVLLDETWIDDEQIQVEDRIHRVSKPRPVYYYYLRSMGSLEERIAQLNSEQKLSGHQLLDGRRGVEFAREVLNIK